MSRYWLVNDFMETDTPRTDQHYATTKTAWPTQADIDFARKFERDNVMLRQQLDASERELKERGVDIHELATALQIEREENARLQSAINVFAEQYREVKAWHDAPPIKRLFDLANITVSCPTKEG